MSTKKNGGTAAGKVVKANDKSKTLLSREAKEAESVARFNAQTAKVMDVLDKPKVAASRAFDRATAGLDLSAPGKEPKADPGNGKVKTLPACLCGCNVVTKGGRFKPGHDMKLRGALLKAGDVKRLQALGWARP